MDGGLYLDICTRAPEFLVCRLSQGWCEDQSAPASGCVVNVDGVFVALSKDSTCPLEGEQYCLGSGGTAYMGVVRISQCVH